MKAAWIAGALAAGLGLRAAFLARHPQFSGDALVYGELAHNLLAHHMFAQMDDTLHATLIRLPGYPLFLALCFKLFGDANYLAVLWVQTAVDLATCALIWALVRRVAGERAGWWALWLSALCPFTANYAAVALAETCSLFCVALAFYALERWMELRRAHLSAQRQPQRVNSLGTPSTRAKRGHPKGILWGIGPAVAAALFVMVPVALWGVRNWRVFHVVEPLGPRYANDPEEEVPYGFMRWYRTWAIGYPATVNVYWQYDGDTVDVREIPARAFDDARQRAETMAAFAEYNRRLISTPAVDARFARLAAERVRAHPVEYYVLLPVAREMEMWFRPRTALMNLPLDWWRAREHPLASAEAMGLALLNAAYLALAVVGVVRWRRARWSGQAALAWAMGAFVVLRCALLLTIDNVEMRYTLECFPVVLVLCGVAMMDLRLRDRAS